MTDEQQLNILIGDGVIDKKQLLLKRFKYLDLDESQAQFLSKIFNDPNVDHTSLDIKQISEVLSMDKIATEALVKSLLEKQCVRLSQDEGAITFDFSIILEKLLKTYLTPGFNDPMEDKINWLNNTLPFKLNEENKAQIIKLIDDRYWAEVSQVATRLSTDLDATWPLFTSMMDAISKKDIEKNMKLKLMLNQNWLEE